MTSKQTRDALDTLERDRFRLSDAESRLASAASALAAARGRLNDGAASGADDPALTKLEGVVAAAEARCATFREAVGAISQALRDGEGAYAAALAQDRHNAIAAYMESIADGIEAALPKFLTASVELAAHLTKARKIVSYGVGHSARLEGFVIRFPLELRAPAETLIADLRRFAPVIAKGDVLARDWQLPDEAQHG